MNKLVLYLGGNKAKFVFTCSEFREIISRSGLAILLPLPYGAIRHSYYSNRMQRLSIIQSILDNL